MRAGRPGGRRGAAIGRGIARRTIRRGLRADCGADRRCYAGRDALGAVAAGSACPAWTSAAVMPFELGEQHGRARPSGRVAEPADRARAGVGHGAAVVEDRHLVRDRADRVDEPADRVERDPPAGRGRRRRARARAARGPAGWARSRASATASAGRRAAAPARAPGRGGRRGRAATEASKHEHALAAGGRRSQPLERRKPAGGVTPGELVLGAVAPWVGVRGDGLEQDLLDRALDRAQRQALLEQPVGAVLVEGGERGGQARAGTTGPRRARGPARSPRRRCGSRPASRGAPRSRSARTGDDRRANAAGGGSHSGAPSCAACLG